MQLQYSPVHVQYTGNPSLVKFGLPVAKATLWHAHHVLLLLDNSELKCTLLPTGYWEDNSIRWLLVEAIVTHSGNINMSIDTSRPAKPKAPSQYEQVNPLAGNTLYKDSTLPISLNAAITLHKQTLPITLRHISSTVNTDDLSAHYKVEGEFTHGHKKLKVACNTSVCVLTGETRFDLTLHNPSAAAHVGGKWDLNDPCSVFINNFAITFEHTNATPILLLEDEALGSNHQIINDTVQLTQHGSGGDNWQSPIHWDANKVCTVSQQGFELTTGSGHIFGGLRAKPVVVFSTEQTLTSIVVEDFWQNFPMALNTSEGACTWQLLGANTELQGGESKTWHIQIASQKTTPVHTTAALIKTAPTIAQGNIAEQEAKNILAYLPPLITFNPAYVNQCKVLPHIEISASPSKLAPFIELGISGPHSFLCKRERKDVYGWRHYGELDADHEAVNANDPTRFISHYNNQYDPLLGMTIQFLHTGNVAWRALAAPLNMHIQDIDIYDTTEDKAEYNGGLMWHTDHYLSAETCTHRSNSKYHQAAYNGFLGGGGPGGQHCYTSGLALQYRLFGDQRAKQKVQQLCKWVRNFYNGSGSILERTFRLLTIDIKQNALTNIGIKAPGYKYPLDRGTANYLHAVIDCYDLSEDAKLLDEMAFIINNTFHPNEAIELRDLQNTEKSWFYTVYLQAVVRYLLLKETIHSIDKNYWFARHALMHYGQWMLKNEDVYLRFPEKLEFPNDTWCAQDIRKVNLFCYFYYFDSQHSASYLQKAQAFYKHVTEHLGTSQEAHFTRILALLMQNDGVVQKFKLGEHSAQAPVSPVVYEHFSFGQAPTHTILKIFSTYLGDVLRLTMRFSITQEWKWLRLRIKSVRNQ